jgi:hypothetical protein
VAAAGREGRTKAGSVGTKVIESSRASARPTVRRTRCCDQRLRRQDEEALGQRRGGDCRRNSRTRSSSRERLFSSVGLVKSDLRGSLLDTTLIDVMWGTQGPQNQLEREQEEVR